MDDIKKEFEKDVAAKKNIARSASKKNVKKWKPMLPHDNITKAELKKLNGKVFIMDPNKKLNWKEFKALSVNLQLEYVNSLVDRFNASNADIAESLGIWRTTFYKHIKNNGIFEKMHKNKGHKGYRIDAKTQIAFEEFVGLISDPFTPFESRFKQTVTEYCDNDIRATEEVVEKTVDEYRKQYEEAVDETRQLYKTPSSITLTWDRVTKDNFGYILDQIEECRLPKKFNIKVTIDEVIF